MMSDMTLFEKPRCVAATEDVCGEGAVWHAAEQALYWADINRFLVHRFTPEGSCVRRWLFSTGHRAIARLRPGRSPERASKLQYPCQVSGEHAPAEVAFEKAPRISVASQARAARHSRITVASDTFNDSAHSEQLSPPKNRASTS